MTGDTRSREQQEWDERRAEAFAKARPMNEAETAMVGRVVDELLGPRPVDPVRLPPLTDEQVKHVGGEIRASISTTYEEDVRRLFPRPEDVPVPVDERQVREQTRDRIADWLSESGYPNASSAICRWMTDEDLRGAS